VTRKHTWKHHISTEDLTRRLGLDTADRLLDVARRQLGWLGHVARMDYSRLPRTCSSDAIVLGGAPAPARRPSGAPRMTYGRSVGKALDTFGLDHNKWPELAADRLAWRVMLRSGVRRAVPTTARRLRPSPPRPIALTHTGPSDPTIRSSAADS
jgi:hypothetical protein